jgi:hypothetical protein
MTDLSAKMTGTPENPDIIDHLMSGIDNADRDPKSGDREMGGVLLTMREAAMEIYLLRQAVTRYCDASRMGTIEPMQVQQAVDRAFELKE